MGHGWACRFLFEGGHVEGGHVHQRTFSSSPSLPEYIRLDGALRRCQDSGANSDSEHDKYKDYKKWLSI